MENLLRECIIIIIMFAVCGEQQDRRLDKGR